MATRGRSMCARIDGTAVRCRRCEGVTLLVVADGAVHNTAKTVGWGLYGACSWTWCIGMYLPIILLERYGWTGFLVFAVPNVLGCAAFGYIVRTRRRSESMITRHRPVMIAFSLVMIAYHLFFIGMLTMRMGGGSESIDLFPGAALALIILAAGLAVSAAPLRVWPWLAVMVYGISVAALFGIGFEPLQSIGWQGVQPTLDAAWLAPTIGFGFLLCPYLDLTFHRAAQQSPSRHSFGVFGVAFAVMLVLTAAYHELGSKPISAVFGEGSLAGRLLATHLFAQMVFTIGAHSRELRAHRAASVVLRRGGGLLLPLLGLAPVVAGALASWSYAVNEQMYIRWLVFYGLIFPAYVLVFIGPWRAKRVTATNLAQLAVAIIAFIPLYELGFIHNWAVAALPPVILLVLAVFITPGTAAKTTKRRNADIKTPT